MEPVGPDEFLTCREAARRLGVSGHLLTRRTRRGELPVYRDPVDHRRHLIRRADLEAFARPRPLREEAAPMAS